MLRIEDIEWEITQSVMGSHIDMELKRIDGKPFKYLSKDYVGEIFVEEQETVELCIDFDEDQVDAIIEWLEYTDEYDIEDFERIAEKMQ